MGSGNVERSPEMLGSFVARILSLCDNRRIHRLLWWRFFRRLTHWAKGGDIFLWPEIQELRFDLDLSSEGKLAMHVQLDVSPTMEAWQPFLLNRELQVREVCSVLGTARSQVKFRRIEPVALKYFGECNILLIRLERGENDFVRTLDFAIDGVDLATGSRDWRGIIWVDENSVRMSEQSAFVPQVPTHSDSPSVNRVKWYGQVTVPIDFELVMPGHVERVEIGSGEIRTWHFTSVEPTTLSLVGGTLQRFEFGCRQESLITLLLGGWRAKKHELLYDIFQGAISFYGEMFGYEPSPPFSLVQMSTINYHWSAPGMVLLGEHSRRLPVGLIGHEVAHFWWGGGLSFRGSGERFLIEGLAEYSSWRFLESWNGAESATLAARQARNSYVKSTDSGVEDPALYSSHFDSPGYAVTVYKKAPLFFRYVERYLGRAKFDILLRSIVSDSWGSVVKGDVFLKRLEELIADRDDPELLLPWLLRAGTLRLAFGLVESSPDGHGLKFGVIARFEDNNTQFCGRVPIVVEGSGESRSVEVRVDSGRGDCSIRLPFVPTVIRMDPDAVLPAAGSLELVRTQKGTWAESGNRPGIRSWNFSASECRENCFTLRVRFERAMDGRQGFKRADIQANLTESVFFPPIESTRWEDRGQTLIIEFGQLDPVSHYCLPLRGTRFQDLFGTPLRSFDLEFRTNESGSVACA